MGNFSPGLEAAVDVGRPVQTELNKGCRGQAGRVTLVAHDNDASVVIGHAGDVVGTLRVESPFEHVAIDDHRTREVTVSLALVDRSDVNDESSSGDLAVEVGWGQPVEAPARLCHQVVNASPRHTASKAHPTLRE
jgi:hypothetical protein